MYSFRRRFNHRILAATALMGLLLFAQSSIAQAIGSTDPSQDGSVGLEGKISSPAPTESPTISTPHSGQSYTATPITIAGLCKTGLLVKVFSNNIFVGSALCVNGSFSLKIDLFSGKNDLVARLYDALDQAGPDSNVVSVNFVDANFAKFGNELSLTSDYARRGANPGVVLTWPIVLSGGTGPYAISIDWGDSSGTELLSQTFAGVIKLAHTFNSSGVYNVIVKATDHNGSTAYLQLVAVANGQASQLVGSGTNNSSGPTVVVNSAPQWYVYVSAIPLLALAFWLGARHELFSIRRRLERSRRAAEQ